jgi:putative DNA primase/helicase
MPNDVRFDVAKDYIERGWKVMLLATDRTGGKIPPKNCARCNFRQGAERHDMEACDCLLCHGFHMATGDLDRFVLMLAALPHGSLAIRTGQASRILVIDAEAHGDGDGDTGIDVITAWEAHTQLSTGLPETLRARSVSGGLHLYYALPPNVYITSGRILPFVDVKAELGYVGAPGVGTREWLNPGTPVAELPNEIIKWLTRGKRQGYRGRGAGTGAVGVGGSGASGMSRPEGYDFELFSRDGAPRGYRDYFINDAIFRLRKRGVTGPALEEQAFEHWTRFDQSDGEFPWEDVKYKVDRVEHEVIPDVDAAETSGYSSWIARLGKPTKKGFSEPSGGMGAPERPAGLGSGPAFANQPPAFEVELTPTGNAHRFVNLFRESTLYVPGLGWHVWRGNVWQYDELNDVLDMTHEVLLQLRQEQAMFEASDDDQADRIRAWYVASSSAGARQSMLELAASDPRVKVSANALDADPWTLVVKNGTIDLRTRKHRVSEPSDFNTRVANVLYDPAAECPRWLEHMKLVSQSATGEIDWSWIAFVQRWMGYTLTGIVDAQKFFFGFGGGNNGKNVMIETLLEIMGEYGIRGSSKLLQGSGQEHETVIADLAGIRMAFIDETPSGRINESRVKELTGSSKVRARKIAKDSFEFSMQAKLWIAGNNKPRVSDSSDGFWRRLDLVPFDAVIPTDQRITNYMQVLLEESSGILNWCLEGLAGYLELGGLGSPQRVVDMGQTYREDENVLELFLADTFATDGSTQWLPNSVIHGMYTEWCESQGVKEIRSMISLGMDFQRAGLVRDPVTRRIRWVWQGKTQVVRGWICPGLLNNISEMLRFERTDGGK